MGLGSGVRKKPILDPGAKKAPDHGSGSATLLSAFFGIGSAPSFVSTTITTTCSHSTRSFMSLGDCLLVDSMKDVAETTA
jgi:hypothetical protein